MFDNPSTPYDTPLRRQLGGDPKSALPDPKSNRQQVKVLEIWETGVDGRMIRIFPKPEITRLEFLQPKLVGPVSQGFINLELQPCWRLPKAKINRQLLPVAA